MRDQTNYIESCIAYYEAKIKHDRELIKNYKKSINERNASEWFMSHYHGCISHYRDLIKKYEVSLKYNQARLAKFKIEKSAASGIKFRIIQGGIGRQ